MVSISIPAEPAAGNGSRFFPKAGCGFFSHACAALDIDCQIFDVRIQLSRETVNDLNGTQ